MPDVCEADLCHLHQGRALLPGLLLRADCHKPTDWRAGMSEPRQWMSPQDVGHLVGFSATFIRRDIALKVLPAQLVPSRAGKVGRWRIHRDDAKAYAIALGVWRGPDQSSPRAT